MPDLVFKIGRFFGNLVKEKDGLEGLKDGFTKFFDCLKEFEDFDFSYNYSKDVLITRSKCPLTFPLWCDRFCLNFVRGFAEAYGVRNVRRVSKRPEADFCVFEFS